jgi:nucleoside-diphosphate-sugar epimerase
MNILVTGANGFVGRALVKRLLAHGAVAPGDRPFERLTVVDLSLDGLPADERVVPVQGSIADGAVLAEAMAGGPDLIFHLASIPGGAAERDFALGLKVNLDATLQLLELVRSQARAPRLVFTSTVAVYGAPMLARVDDATPLRPALSYGAHKLVGEILAQDYCRRGWVDARILRLPGIVARPPSPSGLLSAFMSDVFWKLAAGERFTCPVSPQAIAWWMSAPCCVDNLLHAARLAPGQIGQRRDFTLPVLRLTMGDIVEGLARLYGDDRRELVKYVPDEKLEAGFGSFPPLDASAAEMIGFRHDGSLEALIRNAMTD